MLIAKVMGTVVSTQKDEGLNNLKMLLIEEIDPKTLKGQKNYLVAIDSVGAGLEELVLYASGSSARMTNITNNKPCDCVIMAIIDQFDIDNKTIYKKEL